MSELKPCPFCGGSEQRVKSSGRWGWFVSCSCAAVGPSAGSRDEAIIAWNCRHKPRQATLSDLYGIWKEPDYLCDMCANDCDERRTIRVGQSAYDVCEKWQEAEE